MVLHGTQIPPFIGRLTSSVPRPSEGAPASQGIGPRGRYTRVLALYHFTVDALYRCGREAGPAVSLTLFGITVSGIFLLAPLSLVTSDAVHAVGGVSITQQCSLSNSVASPGSALTATGTLQNLGSSAVTLPDVV